MGTTAYPKFSSKCSSQTHLLALSDGKFVSSITDGEHGSASMDYYNAPENDVRYRALYLIESISQGVHVAQMTTGGARLGDLTANVAVVPYVDGDTFEIYLDGAKRLRIQSLSPKHPHPHQNDPKAGASMLLLSSCARIYPEQSRT